MAVVNLELRWQELKCPPGRAATVYTHDRGADRGKGALALKVAATGTATWLWEYRTADGRKVRRTLGHAPAMTFAEADRQRSIDIATLANGQEPEARSGVKFGELVDRYIAELPHKRKRNGALLRPGYIEKAKRSLGTIKEGLGGKLVSQLGPDTLRPFFDSFRDRPARCWDLETQLQAVFRWALRHRYLDTHPWPERERQGHIGRRERFLSKEELALLLPEAQAIGYPGGSLVLLALVTGRRWSELAGATWDEFDLERGLWVLPSHRAKNGRSHALPLCSPALDVLAKALTHRIGEDGKLVFHRPGVDTPLVNIRADIRRLHKIAEPATDKAIYPEQRTAWAPHDLRRTFATHLEMLECPREIVRAALNHTDDSVTSRYVHSDPVARLRPWLDKLSEHYQNLDTPKS